MVKRIIKDIDIKNLQDQIKRLTIKVEKLEKNNEKINLKKKEIKDPNKPKKYLTNYMFFYKDFRKEYSENNPKTDSKLIAIAAGEEWKKVKENPKKIKKYNEYMEKDKQRYKKEIDEYNTTKN
jgi:hypothetical protein